MHLIGIAGPAGVGKDEFADALVARHGWAKRSFADALYRELALAYRIGERILQHRGTKELPNERLALKHCSNAEFVAHVGARYPDVAPLDLLNAPRSPRWVLQQWGAYRRSNNSWYFINRFEQVRQTMAALAYPPPAVVNPSVRLISTEPHDAEITYLRERGGILVHLSRPGYEPGEYITERPVPYQPGDPVVANDGDLDDLAHRADELVAWLGEQAA